MFHRTLQFIGCACVWAPSEPPGLTPEDFRRQLDNGQSCFHPSEHNFGIKGKRDIHASKAGLNCEKVLLPFHLPPKSLSAAIIIPVDIDFVVP